MNQDHKRHAAATALAAVLLIANASADNSSVDVFSPDGVPPPSSSSTNIIGLGDIPVRLNAIKDGAQSNIDQLKNLAQQLRNPRIEEYVTDRTEGTGTTCHASYTGITKTPMTCPPDILPTYLARIACVKEHATVYTQVPCFEWRCLTCDEDGDDTEDRWSGRSEDGVGEVTFWNAQGDYVGLDMNIEFDRDDGWIGTTEDGVVHQLEITEY